MSVPPYSCPPYTIYACILIHTKSAMMEWPGCLRFVVYNITGCVDYITATYTAFKVTSLTSTFVTNSNVCDATMWMDDTASENSQSSETSRTLVNPEVSQSYLSVEKQTSDVSRFKFPKGRRRKDKLPANAALPKPHLLDVSKQTHSSKPLLKQSSLLLPTVFQWNKCRAILPASVAVSLKLMLFQLLVSRSIPQIF